MQSSIFPLEIHCYHTISRTQCGNNKNIKMHVFLITTTRHGSCTLDQMRRRYHGLWGTKEGNAIRARRAEHAPGRSFCSPFHYVCEDFGVLCNAQFQQRRAYSESTRPDERGRSRGHRRENRATTTTPEEEGDMMTMIIMIKKHLFISLIYKFKAAA